MAEPNSPPQMASSQFPTTAHPPLTPPHSSSSIPIAPPPPSPSRPLPFTTLPLNPLIDLNQNAEQNRTCTNKFLFYNARNFASSEMPVRILFFKNSMWNDFKGEVLESLRDGFATGKSILPLEIDGLKYAFDFLRMLQVHIQTKNHRSIAWIDEDGKPFFPVKFFDCDFSKLDEDIIGVKDASKFPNTRLLNNSDGTYSFVTNLFNKYVGKIDPNASIISIHDLLDSSPIAKARWGAFEDQVVITKEARRGKANVVFGWYTAPVEKVVSIFKNGFRLIRNYPEVRPSIGAGIFLSNLKSPQYSGMQHQVEKDEEKCLLLCRIVLGRMERVDLETHQTQASNKGYDTGCDNPKNPNWYVVWENDINKRILPVCIITCKTSMIKDVNWEMTPVERTMVPRLYLAIKKRVPIEFISPLQDIYDIYKNDGMDMEVFKKNVKAFLGEKKMMQILEEVYEGEF